MFKWIVGGLVLGGGIMLADMIYVSQVSSRLPLDWRLDGITNANQKPIYFRYAVLGAATIVIVAFGAPLLGLGDKSPIKKESSPV